MTSAGKPKGQAARKDTGRRTLERLKPEEAAGVLRHLLEVHPELASEADRACGERKEVSPVSGHRATDAGF